MYITGCINMKTIEIEIKRRLEIERHSQLENQQKNAFNVQQKNQLKSQLIQQCEIQQQVRLETDIKNYLYNETTENTMAFDSEDEYYEEVNRCLLCNCDMGPNNPRQLCGKTYCDNIL